MRFLLVLALMTSRPLAACAPPQADSVLVLKAERRLQLIKDGAVWRDWPMALGFAPDGHKQEEGDGRTPEGAYVIDARNPDSRYFLSLRVSYPNAEDTARATTRGVPPGGDIFIHGQPNGGEIRSGDWTAGCIAVDDLVMREVWELVPDGTPIEIRP
jgi:murein L,D-transpeptidase YafK